MADRQLSAGLEQARAAMEAGDKKQAARALKSAEIFTEYAGSGLQNEWQTLSLQAEKDKGWDDKARSSPSASSFPFNPSTVFGSESAPCIACRRA